MSDDFELELKRDFLVEAQDNLADCESSFLMLESSPSDPEILKKIFRLAHNLKGDSRAVGFGEIAEFTHKLENLVLALVETRVTTSAAVISLLLNCNDRLRHMVGELQNNHEQKFSNDDLVSQIDVALGGGLGGSDVSAPVTDSTDEFFENRASDSADAVVAEHDASGDVIHDANAPWNEVPSADQFAEDPVQEVKAVQATDIADISPHQTDQSPESIAEASGASGEPVYQTPAETSHRNTPTKEEFLRVSLTRLDMLNNLVGELVILQSMLKQHTLLLSDTQAARDLSQLGKLAKKIHEVAMGLRMVPIKATLQKLQRIVRDTSQTLGKEVKLTLKGEDTELDKTVLEQLGDPLVHSVRNAVDHGIEDEGTRIAQGKPREGHVIISCAHEGGQLVIEVIDDGRGLDPQKLLAKARQKGLVKANAQLSDAEAMQLIFHPGFSTKDQVSEVSGRGVGMDVVKTNIEALSGKVQIESQLGQGSRFRIILPLTVAVIDAFIGKVGGQTFVFPLTQVDETLRVAPESLNRVTGLGEVLNLRGKNLPLYRLQKTLNIKFIETKEKLDSQAIIVSHHQGKEFGVIVDDIMVQQQVVVKSLGPEIQNRSQFMGSSILGDGRPALIVDIHKTYGAKGAA